MGNLRDKYTDEEWDELKFRINEDKRNGKPDEIFLHISLHDKDAGVLKKIRIVLSTYYDKYDLSLLDKWIAWKSR